MRPVGVVVVGVDAQDAVEVPAASDQEPIEAVAADRADEAFGERVCLRRAKRGADESLGVGVRLWRLHRRVDHWDAWGA